MADDTDDTDRFRINGIEQLFKLFDGGQFLTEVIEGNDRLKQELLDFADEHGVEKCRGSMAIQIGYQMTRDRGLKMTATATFTGPRKPPSSASAFLDDDGAITLFSPLMRRMQQPVRDATPHDPETGEVREA